jgi:hypothetical protein
VDEEQPRDSSVPLLAHSPTGLTATSVRQAARATGRLPAAILLAVAGRIALATLTYGTNDASMWEASAARIQADGGKGIYGDLVAIRDPQGNPVYSEIFNHPPFMVFVLSGFSRLAGAGGVPLHVALRLLDAAADAGTVLLTAAILRALLGAALVLPLLLVTLAPAWLFISGFHCNSDPLMLFLLVAAVYCIEVRSWRLAGICCFALAAGIKLVPVMLAPALILYFRSARERLLAAAVPALFFLATAIPWLLDSPLALLVRTLGYGSTKGRWGIGYLLRQLPGGGEPLSGAYDAAGRVVLLLALLGAAWMLNRGRRPVALYYQFGLLLFLFHLLTPGFGIQYLLWLTPWMAALPWPLIAVHTAAAGALCVTVYTRWCGGLPWYYANAIKTRGWGRWGGFLGVLAWLTVCWALAAYWCRLRLPPSADRTDANIDA